MFKELDDNLNAMNKEVSKLHTAVEHINQSKLVAEESVNAVKLLQTSFSLHLENVTKDVNNILEPHKQLIKSSENLIKKIAEIDFPTRFDKQEKEMKFLKILLFVLYGLVIIGTITTILILN